MKDMLAYLEDYEKEFLLGRQEELSTSDTLRGRIRSVVESLLEIEEIFKEEA